MFFMTEAERTEAIQRMNSLTWWHAIPIPALGVTTPGAEPASRYRDNWMRIPWPVIRGKAVLDLGARDGLYSFLAEEAGASRVVAVDLYNSTCDDNTIEFASHWRNSRIAIQEANAENLARDLFWRTAFHFVFFFGVLYHLANPYLALEQIATVMAPGGLLILETALTPIQCAAPILEFTPNGRANDLTNWNYPNALWVEAALAKAGFRDVAFQGGEGLRAAWHARWKPA